MQFACCSAACCSAAARSRPASPYRVTPGQNEGQPPPSPPNPPPPPPQMCCRRAAVQLEETTGAYIINFFLCGFFLSAPSPTCHFDNNYYRTVKNSTNEQIELYQPFDSGQKSQRNFDQPEPVVIRMINCSTSCRKKNCRKI